MQQNQIFEIFVEVSRATNFQVIELENQFATAVYKEPFSIKKLFLRCIPFSGKKDPEQEYYVSAVRLTVHVNEAR